MHDFLWFSTDLIWYWFLFWLLLAIGIAFFISRVFRSWGAHYLGALIVFAVIFWGVPWNPDGWARWLVWLFWPLFIVGLITGVLSLFDWGRRSFVAKVAGFCTVADAVILLLLLVLIPVVNLLPGLPDVETYSDNDPVGLSSTPHVSSTEEPPGTTDGDTDNGTTEGTTGSTTCRNATWSMTEGEPARTTKVIRQGIHNADTGLQAFQAFYAWHDTMAMDNATIYQQLADAVHADPPSEASLVSSGGFATPAMSQLVCRVTSSLDGAHYYPEHSDIRVVLTDGTVFRVMAASGQVQQ